MHSALLLLSMAAFPNPVTLKDVEGKPRVVIGDRKHKATVLYVILAECPIARKFSAEIRRTSTEYAVRGVASFIVQADPQASTKDARIHAREFGLDLPTILDRDHRLVKLAKATAVPTAAVFDPSGKLVYSGRIDDRFPALGVQRKASTRHDLRLALDQVLSGKAVQPSHTAVVGCAITPP